MFPADTFVTRHFKGSHKQKHLICFWTKTSDNESEQLHVPLLALTGASWCSDSHGDSPNFSTRTNNIHLNRFTSFKEIVYNFIIFQEDWLWLLTRLLGLDSDESHTDDWSDQNHHWYRHNGNERQPKTPGNSGKGRKGSAFRWSTVVFLPSSSTFLATLLQRLSEYLRLSLWSSNKIPPAESGTVVEGLETLTVVEGWVWLWWLETSVDVGISSVCNFWPLT